MRRRRSRTRAKNGRSAYTLGIIVVVALISGHVLPVGSVTSGQLPRDTAFDVVNDEDGVVGLDVEGSVTVNQIEPLVDVTNRFESDVTVTLQDASDGDLYVNGNNRGDTATVTIGPDGTKTISIKAKGPSGSQVDFDVTASTAGLSVVATDRSTTVESAGNGNGNGNGNNP